MRFAVLSSAQLAGPDNPHARLDPAYNLAIHHLRTSATISEAEAAGVLDVIAGGTGGRDRLAALRAALNGATSREEIVAAATRGLGLTAPTPELAAGIGRLVDTLIEQRRREAETAVAAGQQDLKRLSAMRPKRTR